LLSAASLTIQTTEPQFIIGLGRKTAGHASSASLGMKQNSTVIGEAATAANSVWQTGSVNEIQEGSFFLCFGSRVANYEREGTGATSVYSSSAAVNFFVTKTGQTADIPTAEITAVVLRGLVGNASITLGADEMQVYSLAAS
jgi:hypothetical protein